MNARYLYPYLKVILDHVSIEMYLKITRLNLNKINRLIRRRMKYVLFSILYS